MANTDIIPPRVDFIDQRTNKISREWFLFLLEVFRRVGGTESSSSIPDVVVDGYLEAIQPIHGLVPSPFIDVDPKVVQLVERIMLEVAPPQAIGFPYPNWQPNQLEASLAQLRQEFTDFRSLVETAPTSTDVSTGSGEVDCADVNACVDAVTIEALGYWSPLTNGDPVSPELVFDAEGDTIAVFTPTP